MILMLMVKHSQNPQNSKFAMFLQYLKKEDMKLIFCMQINIKVSHKLISTLWGSKFPRWYYYYWWAWSSILKVFKLRSLQYLCNISKKEVSNGVHFLHADKYQSFKKLALLVLMEVARHVQSAQNRKNIFAIY